MTPASSFIVPPELAGERLDRYLTLELDGPSRSHLKRLIDEGAVLVNGSRAKAGQLLRTNDRVEVAIEGPRPSTLKPEAIPLHIVYQDADLAVIDKPAGLVVHPGAGHTEGTLVNALLYHLRDLSGLGGELRPGIVHRLDRGTSGLMVVAKHDRAHRALADQFRARAVEKEYLALVWGRPVRPHGTIERAVGRDPVHRLRMSVQARAGRTARTAFDLVQRYPGVTLLRVRIFTGRTHQIRVHMASIDHPVVGDSLYARRRHTGRPAVDRALAALTRPFLHASRLALTQPTSAKRLEFASRLPEDLQAVLRALDEGRTAP